MEDYFFDNSAPSTIAQSNVHQEENFFVDESSGVAHEAHGGAFHQEAEHPQQQQFDDDFFGTQQSTATASQQHYAVGDSDFYNTVPQQQNPYNDHEQAYSGQVISNGYLGQHFEASSHQELSEQDQRKQRLQNEEQERRNKLIERQDEENANKRQRVQNARSYLQQQKSEREAKVLSRKQNAIQEEDIAVEARSKVTFVRQLGAAAKNPWDKITENINLKVSELSGDKDVSRMRECILNKKSDLQNQSK